MTDTIQSFIQRWQSTSGTERANCHLFLTELCTLLAVQEPLRPEQMARQFARASTPRVNELLQTLESLGLARRLEDGRYVG